jgi:hypothetical protein
MSASGGKAKAGQKVTTIINKEIDAPVIAITAGGPQKLRGKGMALST